MAYKQMELLPEAMGEFERVQHHEFLERRRLMAGCLADQGLRNQAIALLERSVEQVAHEQPSTELLYQLGCLYWEEEQIQEAVTVLSRVGDLNDAMIRLQQFRSL